MKKRILVANLLLCTSLWAQDLAVHLDGDYLRIALPHVDFLKGKPLERLKDGASVAFIGQLTITTTPNSLNPVARAVARFALSYDIWEERFSVTKMGQTPDSRRSAALLSVQQTENWCLDNLAIVRSRIPPDQPFLRSADPATRTYSHHRERVGAFYRAGG